jgi:hypothetical protein
VGKHNNCAHKVAHHTANRQQALDSTQHTNRRQ